MYRFDINDLINFHLRTYLFLDWDRIAREWEREEMEEDERERAEEMKRKPNIQFDPNNIGLTLFSFSV